jgi:hypothetical protein
MSELTISLPNWPIGRIVTESMLEAERLGGERFPDKVEWAVIGRGSASLRLSQAFELRFDRDTGHPGRLAGRDQAAGPSGLAVDGEHTQRAAGHVEDERWFNRLSRRLADLHGEKDRILLTLARARGRQKRALEDELRTIQEAIDFIPIRPRST